MLFKSVKIFINYRRGDSSAYAGRIYDNLKDDFDVFFDIDGINIGNQFKSKIEKEIKSSTIILALLDKDCIKEFDKRKGRDDFVLFELEYAHENSITVIPLLINGYPMPTKESLPKSLSFLPSLHAFDVRHEKFSDDIESLKREIHKNFGRRKFKRMLFVCGISILIFFSLFIFNKEFKEFFSDTNSSIQSISSWLSIGSSNTNNISIEYKGVSHDEN